MKKKQPHIILAYKEALLREPRNKQNIKGAKSPGFLMNWLTPKAIFEGNLKKIERSKNGNITWDCDWNHKLALRS